MFPLPCSIMIGSTLCAIRNGASTFTAKASLHCPSENSALAPTALTPPSYTRTPPRPRPRHAPWRALLVARAIGDEIKWHHKVLITIGVLINLMGVLWIYQFEPNQTNGWSWVSF